MKTQHPAGLSGYQFALVDIHFEDPAEAGECINGREVVSELRTLPKDGTDMVGDLLCPSFQGT